MHGQEEKKKAKKGNIVLKIKEVNKKAWLLTDPELVELYAEHEVEIQEKAAEKVQRKEVKGWYSEAIKKWNATEGAMKKRCEEITVIYQAALTEWEEGKKVAKQEKRRSQLKKPIWGPLPKADPKPKMADFESEDSSGEEFEQEEPDAMGSDDK